MRLDFIIIYFLYLFNSKPSQAAFTLMGHYYSLFFLIQPLLMILLKDSQRNNGYMLFRNFSLATLCLLLFIINETVLLKQSKYFELLYIIPLLFYWYIEAAHESLIKLFYVVFGIYKEDTFYEFHGLNYYAKKQNAKMKTFKVHLDSHYKKNQKVYFKKLSGMQGVWKRLQFIVREEKENRIQTLKDDRRKKINEYLTLLKQQKHELSKEFNSDSKNENLQSLNKEVLDNNTFAESLNRPQKSDSIEIMKLNNKNNSIVIPDNKVQDKKNRVYSLSKFKTDQFEKAPNNFCQRLRRLCRSPKRRFNKIMHFFLFPFALIFKLTQPCFEKDQTLRALYFGFIACNIYILGLSILTYMLNNILQYYWQYSDLMLGFINSLPQLSFLIYCYFSRIINEFYLTTFFLEVIIVDFSIIIIPKLIYGIVKENLIDHSLYYCIVTVGVLVGFNLLSSLVNIYFKGYIPKAFHYILFFGLAWLVIEYFITI